MSDQDDFLAVTRSYERWRAPRISVVADDAALEHQKLAASPFVLLRGTYYRFLQQFRVLLPQLAPAPSSLDRRALRCKWRMER